ncbi:MAG: hypothetical protein RL701_6199 [Pseudomonadota bacterium]
MSFERVLILGCGYVGERVLALARARGLPVVATVRSQARVPELERAGAHVLCAAELGGEIRAHVDATTRVVVAFPGEPATDARILPWLCGAHSVVYISSTGVYGELSGRIDATTPLPAAGAARVERLQSAEARYARVGATLLRSPAIYGPDRGLHMRILRGEHRVPGDGSQWLSRIHAFDLAQFALATTADRGRAFVVGDLEPAPHIQVVRFVCETYGVPLPPEAPLASLHASLRADRAVDASHALQQFGVTLRYPSYRQGMAREETGVGSGSTGPVV